MSWAAPARSAAAAPELEQRNLFAVAERHAARAASPATRKQYASIYRAFGDWLMGELGRPPLVGDLDVDAIAASARHLERGVDVGEAGRAGHPARLLEHGPSAGASARAP